MRTVVQFIQKEGRVWGELLSFIFCVYPYILVFNFSATQIFHGRAPPLGRLGCRRRARKSFQWWRRRLPGVYPYLSSIYLQISSKSIAPSPLSSHRRLLGLVGTWQMGTIGKRTLHSQLLALSDFTACKIVLKQIVRIPYFCSYLAITIGVDWAS